MKWPRTENWKAETMLRELPLDEVLTIERPGRSPLRTTPREIMRKSRVDSTLFIDQVERTFSALSQ